MNHIKPNLNILTEEHKVRLHGYSLQVLKEVGVSNTHAEIDFLNQVPGGVVEPIVGSHQQNCAMHRMVHGGGTGVDGQLLLPTLTGCSFHSQSKFEIFKFVEPIVGSNQITHVHNMMPEGIMLKTEGLGWMDNRCCPP